MKAFFVGWLTQSLLAFDQAINAILMPLITWSVGWSDETLSARCWRSRYKPWAKVLLPIIDAMFWWQKADSDIRDETGEIVTGHCARAYMKEKLRRYMPPEYREGA